MTSNPHAQKQTRWLGLAAFLAVAAAGFLVPSVLAADVVDFLMRTLILGLFALSTGFLTGQLGLTSLGHVVFYGSTGYVMAISTTHLGLGIYAAITLALITVIALGTIMGLISVRVPGIGFTMITLGFAQAAYFTTTLPVARPYTNGDDGIVVTIDSFLGRPGYELFGTAFWSIVWTTVVVVIAVLYLVKRSVHGLKMYAVQENIERARFSGLRTLWIQVSAFVLTAMVAGLAGVLMVLYNQFVSPADFGFVTASFGLVAAFLGGPSSLLGPFVGALILEVARANAGSGQQILYLGVALMATMLVLPQGVMGTGRSWWRRLRAHRRRDHPPATPPSAESPTPHDEGHVRERTS